MSLVPRGGETLSERLPKKSDNLELIKLIAAALVIFHHSVPICGSEYVCLINRFSRGSISWGGFAVAVFFSVSGFYVTKSLCDKKDGKKYFLTRFFRIYPPFLAVMLITVFVMGPVVSELSAKEYFSDAGTYKYLRYLLFIPDYSLPGVFVSNPMHQVNGSLWSLVLECICYVFLYAVYKLKIFDSRILMAAAAFLCAAAAAALDIGMMADIRPVFYLAGYVRPFLCFVSGMLLFRYRDRVPVSRTVSIICLAALPALIFLRLSTLAVTFLMPYLICAAACLKRQCPKPLSSLGRYSYLIYLTVFPVQQTVYLTGLGRNPALNTAVSAAISLCVSALLFYLVEKPSAALLGNILKKKPFSAE